VVIKMMPTMPHCFNSLLFKILINSFIAAARVKREFHIPNWRMEGPNTTKKTMNKTMTNNAMMEVMHPAQPSIKSRGSFMMKINKSAMLSSVGCVVAVSLHHHCTADHPSSARDRTPP
jgi:hypothetical protein